MDRRRKLTQERFEMVRRFEASGLSAAEFARHEGVSVGTLANWRKRLARETTEDGRAEFVPVTLVRPPESSSGDLERPMARLRLSRGLTLEVGQGANPREIAALVEALGC